MTASYIWCGSNKGNIYVFDRETLKHVYLIPTTKEYRQLVLVKAMETKTLTATANRSLLVRMGMALSFMSIYEFSVDQAGP